MQILDGKKVSNDIKNEIETDSFIKFENLCINIIKWNEMTKGKELYIIRDPPLLIVKDNYNNSEITVALTEDIIEDNRRPHQRFFLIQNR